jgi:hypothetical protein
MGFLDFSTGNTLPKDNPFRMFKPGDEEYKKFRQHTHEQHFITKGR